MALNSPGVQVTIIDQSQYLPAASSSVPLIVVATANNKADSTGTAIAAGTLAANANKLYQITSQRDLVNYFGSPFFYKTTDGTPIHGYELNEYGLLAAYSLLGVSNQCWILRADVDLGALVGKVSRPSGPPADGTYWLDTTNSTWGIFELNAELHKFEAVTPIVITDTANLTNIGTSDVPSYVPKQSIGNIGDYAVVPLKPAAGLLSASTYFYKDMSNIWQEVGSSAWKNNYPVVSGSRAVSGSLNAGDTFTIQVVGGESTYQLTATVPASPNNNLGGLINAINGLHAGDIRASQDTPGVISLYYNEYGAGNWIQITAGTGSVLSDIGITAGIYYGAEVAYGTSAQMPLWTSSQDNPRPSGSVWIKTSSVGGGMNLVLSKYSTTTAAFTSVATPVYSDELTALASLDSTGGKAIPTNTVFAMVGASTPEAGVILYNRLTTGPTIVTGSITNPTPTSGSLLTVVVSLPGTNQSSTQYQMTMSGTTATSFVLDWAAANIPYTTASITTSGSIQITHTLGGDIYLSDLSASGVSNGLINQLGFSTGTTLGVRKSFLVTYSYTGVTQDSTTGGGSGAHFTITNNKGHYQITSITSGGSSYNVGDRITVHGTKLGGLNGVNDLTFAVQHVTGGAVTQVSYVSGNAEPIYWTALSNWVELKYVAELGAPAANPTNGTYWYYSTDTEVDIMVNKTVAGVPTWVGYKNTNFDLLGHPKSTGSNATDPLGIIIETTIPTQQSNGSALSYGDLWLNASDLENFPNLHRWQQVNGVDQWVAIDNTDQVSSSGILFADARWGSSTTVDPVNDPIPSIASLLTNNYVDLDCPNPALYPQGMLLFNTRRSGYNVKKFVTNYFTQANYPNAGGSLPQFSYTWVSASGLKPDGSAYMGRKAQRHMVVQALKAAIGTNMTIREEDNFFNLISCPGYPELQPDMVGLNNERNNTAYIIGDTPLRLKDQATDITNWATNAAGATETGEEGWVTRDEYLGIFYPSGITTDLTGAQAVVPASHMMLRTFLRNDTVAYPWFAAAGTRRGTIDNATNIGYLNSTTGEFITVKNRVSIRDVLYTNQINPLAYFTGLGLLNYGNKSSYASNTAMDRTNVGRLIAYIRYQLQIAARPFVFEPNDALTRSQVTGVVQSLFIDLVAKRGLYDYLVVCDDTNNTPARIDRNELWIDIAIEPVKSTEFIYIPVRILNTGGIAKLK